MAYKFQLGDARMSGSLTQEEGITVVAGGLTVTAGTSALQATTATTLSASSTVGGLGITGTSLALQSGGITAAGAIAGATTIGSSGAATLDSGAAGSSFAGALTIAGGAGSSGVTITDAGALTADGIVKTDDTTEATSTTDGSLQTDGGLSVAKSAVIGDDLDLLSDGCIINVGSTSKFTLTDQAANNCVMAASGARLAFGNAGEYITGDGTDLAIISSGDVDINATTAAVAGALSSTGAATLASASGVTTIGSTTGATFSAAGLLNVNNATDATSTTDGSLQTDGGLSVVKDAIFGNDVGLASDSAVLTLGAGADASLTHDGTTGLTVAAAPISINSTGDLTLDSTTDIVLDAAGGNFEFKDAGTAMLTIDVDGTAGDIDVNLMVDGDDLVFNQFDGTEVLRLTDGGDVQIATGLIPDANDGAYIGTAAKQFSDLFLAEGGVINWDNGDATLTQAANVVTLAGATLSATFTNSLSKAGNSGLAMTTYNGSAAVSNLAVDLSTLTAATVDVATDSIAIIDSSDSNGSRQESIVDLVSGMAGSGLTATNGVLSTDAGGTPTALTIGATAVEGMNYINSTLTGAFAAYLPAAPTAGDIVYIKAKDGVTTSNSVTIIKTTASHTIDGGSEIVIESPYGAVSLSYVAANDWRVF
jgi:hypothetical protein